MMTFKERIEREKNNLTGMVLYYDRGLFFNLVDRSGYAFHTRIKPFKVHVKTLKGLDEPYVTLGVPVSKKDEYLKDISFEDDGIACITAHLEEPIDEKMYQMWKKHVIELDQNEKRTKVQTIPTEIEISKENSTSTENKTLPFLKDCLSEIQTLNIATMTPMEAMIFLNQLQVKLRNVKL